MQVLVLGAGIIGISTAWHLLEQGHEVTVVERQGDAALETSFANAAQISVSHCEPWASRQLLPKLPGWMLRRDSPLLFRPRLDWQQWRWGLAFLRECNDAAYERNLRQLVALGRYSHAALKDLVAATGIEYHRLERGIAQYYTDRRAFDEAATAAELMRRHGVDRRVIDTKELLAIEPALASFAHRIVGATYTASDETGDARVFTQQLAARCAARGARLLYRHHVLRLRCAGNAIDHVAIHEEGTGAGASKRLKLKMDAVVVACGAASAPLLRAAGVDLPIYPGKGYSATFQIVEPDRAPSASVIDDELQCAFTRLGDQLRAAGTIELAGFDLSLDTPTARARCRLLAERVEQVLPGVCDTRSEEEGGAPHWWTGLRPATPTNVPFIGATRVKGLWVNAGHGTLGWTLGAGSGRAIAELISGRRPAIEFGFLQGGRGAGAAVA